MQNDYRVHSGNPSGTGANSAPSHSRRAESASRTSRPLVSSKQKLHSPHNPRGYASLLQQPPLLQPLKRRLLSVVVAVAILVVLIGGGMAFAQSLPVAITLNGQSVEVGGKKTIADALKESGIQPQPGDLVAVDGSVIEAGKGELLHAVINGEETSSPDAKLAAGDVVEIGNGRAIEEPFEVAQVVIPWGVEVVGTGAIHLIEGVGKDGLQEAKTGKTSGLVVNRVLEEPQQLVRRNVSPDVGGEKVIALTFDDGPWSDQTSQILDVLAQYGAKSTFFTLGNRIERDGGAALVKRAVAEGHQIATHTYDHAAGSGQSVNLGYMSPEEQVAEVEKGYAAIEAATGQPSTRVIRTPGGNFGPEVVRSIAPLITAEIGWNIDSRDWKKPGPEAIAQEIENAWPGAIVLAHDGGGDRAQTIEALKIALPRLKELGYRFITIDELMQYPVK